MTKIPFVFFLLTTLFFSSSSSDADQRLHSRHLLHQPFFPVITDAPPPSSSSEPPSPSPHKHHHHKKHPETTQPPPPPPHEKHLFSSVATPPPSPPHPNSFFPSSDPTSTVSHRPPPPRPSSLPTFPANISSLLFPTHNTNPKPHKARHIAKLITITASVISAASLLSLFAVFIIFLRRTRRHHRRRSSPAFDTKSTRSDSLQLFNGAPSDKQPPKYASSHTSSEFLYLGTLVNSRSTGLDNQKSPVNVTGVLELPAPPPASSSSSSSYSQYHKLGSPELRPLPPLPKLPTFSPMYQSREQLNPKRHDFDGDDNENENDEFYSPRGSSGRKQSFMKDSDLDQSNSVSSLNGSPVISLRPSSVSPSLNDCVSSRPVPTRPPPPPPPQPRLSDIPATMTMTPEKEEESLKPKLKALHWDKVRASSSRVMVWDQIKGNSFQYDNLKS